MEAYFNTTNATTGQLKKYKFLALSQNKRISRMFFNDMSEATPSEIWRAYNDPDTPLTSIRRSINTLTKIGHIEKTSEKRIGMYGRHEHIWKIKF
jgi:hypothetical protein